MKGAGQTCSFANYYLAHTGLDLRLLSSGLPNYQVLAGCFGDVHRQALKTVDP